jgi:hypothetical protein
MAILQRRHKVGQGGKEAGTLLKRQRVVEENHHPPLPLQAMEAGAEAVVRHPKDRFTFVSMLADLLVDATRG